MSRKKILLGIYEEIKENLIPNAEYNKQKDKYVRLREKFLKKIGKRHRYELEKVTDAIFSMTDELDKQIFIEGFATALQIYKETTNKE